MNEEEVRGWLRRAGIEQSESGRDSVSVILIFTARLLFFAVVNVIVYKVAAAVMGPSDASKVLLCLDAIMFASKRTATPTPGERHLARPAGPEGLRENLRELDTLRARLRTIMEKDRP